MLLRGSGLRVVETFEGLGFRVVETLQRLRVQGC